MIWQEFKTVLDILGIQAGVAVVQMTKDSPEQKFVSWTVDSHMVVPATIDISITWLDKFPSARMGEMIGALQDARSMVVPATSEGPESIVVAMTHLPLTDAEAEVFINDPNRAEPTSAPLSVADVMNWAEKAGFQVIHFDDDGGESDETSD